MPHAADAAKPAAPDDDDDERMLGALRGLVAAHGLHGAARLIGCGREQIARVLGGIDVRAGTLALLRARLRELAPRPQLP